MGARIASINVSEKKGTRKAAVEAARVIEAHGIEGDAHAGDGERQVSFLGLEHVQYMRDKGLDVGPGAFAENITTEGLDLDALAVGDGLRLGRTVEIEITRKGKECHAPCAIYRQAGECAMPVHGVFARVRRGGPLRVGDPIEVLPAKEG